MTKDQDLGLGKSFTGEPEGSLSTMPRSADEKILIEQKFFLEIW